MTYQTTFVSSESEEKKRRALLSGARRFSFSGYEFYYSYSPSLQTLKERITIGLYQIEKILNRLGPIVKKEYQRSCLLHEISCSCSLDNYPYLRRLEWLYLKNKPIPAEIRTSPIKNLSLKAGFSTSSPCKNDKDIGSAIAKLEELDGRFRNEDRLIWSLVRHFLFEFIHPYRSMNGVIGRYQIYKNLEGTPYEFLGMKFAASFLNQQKSYFLSFKQAESSFDLNDYLEIVLERLFNEISKTLQDLEEKEKTWNRCATKLDAYKFNSGELKTAKGMLMMRIFSKQKLNLTRLAHILQKSERSVFRHALSLKHIDFDMF